jgi:hypothetical protein
MAARKRHDWRVFRLLTPAMLLLVIFSCCRRTK